MSGAGFAVYWFYGTISVCLGLTGRAAALGMMGRPTEIKTVPYFWSAMFGKSLRYAGKQSLTPQVI
jgi:hypothetical protein